MFKESTYAKVTYWTEFRTPSGRWSRVRHELKEHVYDSTSLESFFSSKMMGERWRRAHFREGYLPYRVTVSSPDNSERVVYLFDYRTED